MRASRSASRHTACSALVSGSVSWSARAASTVGGHSTDCCRSAAEGAVVAELLCIVMPLQYRWLTLGWPMYQRPPSAAPTERATLWRSPRCPMVPTWVEPAVNAERRRLRETPRLAVLSSLVEAKIAAIKADPGRERGMSERVPSSPASSGALVCRVRLRRGPPRAVAAGRRQGAHRRDRSRGPSKTLAPERGTLTVWLLALVAGMGREWADTRRAALLWTRTMKRYRTDPPGAGRFHSFDAARQQAPVRPIESRGLASSLSRQRAMQELADGHESGDCLPVPGGRPPPRPRRP